MTLAQARKIDAVLMTELTSCGNFMRLLQEGNSVRDVAETFGVRHVDCLTDAQSMTPLAVMRQNTYCE